MRATTRSLEHPNRLLAALSAADLKRLRPYLRPVKLKLRQKLELPDKPIENIYFMHAGITSVVAGQNDGASVEIGIIGREGMTGTAIMLGNDRTPHSTFIQVAGSGERIATDELRKAVKESDTLHRVLLNYVQSFMIQTAHTAVANGRAKLPERLARWLLMAQDRLGGDMLPLTHEFLSLMLSVRRAGVTETLQKLRQKKLIEAARGEIIVLNRAGLERLAGEFYGVPEQEYQRLIG